MVPFPRPSQRSRRSFDQHQPARAKGERDQYIMTFPIHPLPSMQAPFEESMLDATGETGFVPFPDPNKSLDARQKQLCKDSEADEMTWNFTYNCHWRNNSKGKFHPLAKTVTQIVFGVHLLHQHLEKSVADVADILLKHVNELDGFLQRANEDIEGSLRDMLFRRKCLKVPMEHVNEFDRLLDDRTYRAQLLDGNITIERTINRMSTMLNDYLIDMSTFRDANQHLDMYLLNIGDAWADANDDVGRIYSAMCGNTGGWAQFLQSLVAKAEKLGVVLVQVSSYCNEIEKRCGAASRRSLIASRSSSRNSSNSREAARAFGKFADNKPLPKVPSERPPPFMSSPSSSNNTTPEIRTPQRRPNNRPPALAAEFRSDESPQRRSDTAQSSKTTTQTSTSATVVPRLTVSHQPDHRQPRQHHPLAATEQHQDLATHDESDRITLRPTHRQRSEQPSQSDKDTNDTVAPKRIATRGAQGDYSPTLTGKDSAYSSVSGASFASPTAVQPPCSASSHSSYPRPQFGLFPSSAPSTPMQSMSGRHGAISPALVSHMPLSQTGNYSVDLRPQTSLDNHTPPSRRLLKKSSLSSLKRLFSKRKYGSVETIVE